MKFKYKDGNIYLVMEWTEFVFNFKNCSLILEVADNADLGN